MPYDHGERYTDILQDLQSLEQNLECPICLDILEDTHVVPACQHRFCGKCIQESLRKCNNECPSCRAHISTKRSLRADPVFESLVQSLYFIIDSARSNDVDRKVTFDSLTALKWHFLCPLCDELLNNAHVSSECLHRICSGCVGQLGSRRICPCCSVSTPTTFSIDKQFDEIVQAVDRAIRFLERDNSGPSKDACPDPVISRDIEPSTTLSDGAEKESEQAILGHRKDAYPIISQDIDASIAFDHVSIDDLAQTASNSKGAAYPDPVTSRYLGKSATSTIANNSVTTNDGTHNGNSDAKTINAVLQENVQLRELRCCTVSCGGKKVFKRIFERSKRKAEVNKVKCDKRLEIPVSVEVKSSSLVAQGMMQKYPTGTTFKNSITDRCGRIVGFDGKLYQVYYPQDGTCDAFTETEFERNQVVRLHRRPSRRQKAVDLIPCCPMCKKLFSSSLDKSVASCLPVQSQKCSHVICLDCIQSIRVSESQSSGRSFRSTIDCPLCDKTQSFNCKEPTICLPMCQMVSIYNKMKLKGGSKQTPHQTERMMRHKRKRDDSREESRGIKKIGKLKSKQKEKNSSKTKLSGDMKCTICVKEKPLDKFSSKQIKNGIEGRDKVLCRRCEEKGKVQSEWGSGFQKFSTTLYTAKAEKSKPKFLTTVVPWGDGKALKLSINLPTNLILVGYSREPFGRLSNEDYQQEALWSKNRLWSTGDGIVGFIKFLQKQKKSAYGTFLQPDGADGFFIIPYDQPPKNIFICKCIIGLGVIGDSTEERERKSLQIGEASNSNSTLRKLLAAEYNSNQSLIAVPKGSVKAAKKISAPQAPKVSHGPSDWFREKTVIEEPSEDEFCEDDEDINFDDGVDL